MRRVLGCLVLLAASPAFGYLMDIRGAGDSEACIHAMPGDSFTVEMYFDTQLVTGNTATSAEGRIGTVRDSSNAVPVPDVLQITGPAAVPVTVKGGTIVDYLYPQYNSPLWKNNMQGLATPLPIGAVNAGAGSNWSTSRIGSVVATGFPQPASGYIYGRVKLATFTVKIKDSYNGPISDNCASPSFYIVAADAYCYAPAYYPPGSQPGTQYVNPGAKIAVCVTPEPATALLLLGVIPLLRRRR